jgi:hypothetical protein
MDDSILRLYISKDYLCSIDVYFPISNFYLELSPLKSSDFLTILEITRECLTRDNMEGEDVDEICFLLRSEKCRESCRRDFREGIIGRSKYGE